MYDIISVIRMSCHSMMKIFRILFSAESEAYQNTVCSQHHILHSFFFHRHLRVRVFSTLIHVLLKFGVYPNTWTTELYTSRKLNPNIIQTKCDIIQMPYTVDIRSEPHTSNPIRSGYHFEAPRDLKESLRSAPGLWRSLDSLPWPDRPTHVRWVYKVLSVDLIYLGH